MQWLRRSFLAGFFVTVPLFISVAAFVWLFGVVALPTIGSLIHLLLVIALIAVILQLLGYRRTVV
jgi:uncharacterized membrane protein